MPQGRLTTMRFLLFGLIVLPSLLHSIPFPNLETKPANWLNAPPDKSKAGTRPTLLFIFTRDCGNCHRSHTFLNGIQNKYGTKLQIIGIHTPEFAWEKDPDKLRSYASRNGIRYPVFLDAEMKVWNALENHYWPAFYLFDANGRHTATFIGETHQGDGNARQIEAAVRVLMPNF